MKKLNLLVLSAVMTMGLVSCGQPTEVPPTESTPTTPAVDLTAVAKEAYGLVSATYDAFTQGIGGDQALAKEAKLTAEDGKEYTFQVRYTVAESAKTWLAIAETGDKLIVTQDYEEHTLVKAFKAEVLFDGEVKHTAEHNVRVAKLVKLADIYNLNKGDAVTTVGKLVRIRDDGNGYHIAVGDHAIYVYTKDALPEGVVVGDTLKVGGTLDIYNGLYELKPNSVEKVTTTVEEPVALDVATVTDLSLKTLQSREAAVNGAYIIKMHGEHKTSSKGGEYELVEATVYVPAATATIVVRAESRKMSAEDFATWGWTYDATTGKGSFSADAPVKGDALTATGFVDFYNGKIQVSGAKFVSKAAFTGEVPNIPEPAAKATTVGKLLKMDANTPNTETAFEVKGIFEGWDGKKYGNFNLVDPTTGEFIAVYGSTTTAGAVAWDTISSYAFNNPKDAVTSLAGIQPGEEVTMKALYLPYQGKAQISGEIIAHAPSTATYTASVVADPTCTVTLSKTENIAYGETITVTAEPTTPGHVVLEAYVEDITGNRTSIKDTMTFKATCVNKVTVVYGDGYVLTGTDLGSKDYNVPVNAEVGGVTWVGTQVADFGNGMQMKYTKPVADKPETQDIDESKPAVNSELLNSTAFSKAIKSVTINLNPAKSTGLNGKSLFVVETGATAFAEHDVIDDTKAIALADGTFSYTVNANAGDTFLRIAHTKTSGTVYVSSIVVLF